MTSVATFTDILNLVQKLPSLDSEALRCAQERNSELTKPHGALGLLEELAFWLSAWQGRHPPSVKRCSVCVFASNHGITMRGVSAFPQEVTAQMVKNFRSGGAAINQLCAEIGADLEIYDLELNRPTCDIVIRDAMDEADCVTAICHGMNAVSWDMEILGIGEMGIGNTTIASALCHALFSGDVDDWVGLGTMVDSAGLERKRESVIKAVERVREVYGATLPPLEILRSLGGREIAAMFGAILAARLRRVPIVIDGFVSSAAAAVLYQIDPKALDHCVFSHISAEKAHKRLLNCMNKRAILDLGMRLGEGSGAALAIGIIKAAARTHNDMSSFSEASVSGRNI